MARCWCADGFEITCGESCRDHGGDCQKKCWDGSQAEQCDTDQGCPPCQRHCADGTIAPDCNLDACESGRCEQQSWIDEDTGCLMRYTDDCVPEQECPEGSSCTARDGTGRTACGHVDDCEDCHCTPDHPWSGSSCQYECREGLFRPGHEDGCGECLPSCTSSIPCQVIDDGVVKKGHLNTCCECIPESCTPGGGCTTAEGGKGTRQSDCSCKPNCEINNPCRTESGVIGKMDKNCNCVGDCPYHGSCGTRKWYDKDCNCICNNISKMSPCTTSGGSWTEDCQCDCPSDKHLENDRCVCNSCHTNEHHPSGSCSCVCNECKSGDNEHITGNATDHTCGCACDECQAGYHQTGSADNHTCKCEPDSECDKYDKDSEEWCACMHRTWSDDHGWCCEDSSDCSCLYADDTENWCTCKGYEWCNNGCRKTDEEKCVHCNQNGRWCSGDCWVTDEDQCVHCDNKCWVNDDCKNRGDDCTTDEGFSGKVEDDCTCVHGCGPDTPAGKGCENGGRPTDDCECECPVTASAGDGYCGEKGEPDPASDTCGCRCKSQYSGTWPDCHCPDETKKDNCECVDQFCNIVGTWNDTDCSCNCGLGGRATPDSGGHCVCKETEEKRNCTGKNKVWDGTNCLCTCSEGRKDSCTASDSQGVWNDTTCTCNCGDREYDDATGKCKCDPSTDAAKKKCDESEDGNWDPVNCECECPSGYETDCTNSGKGTGIFDHETCTCICGDPWTRDSSSNTCVCDTSKTCTYNDDPDSHYASDATGDCTCQCAHGDGNTPCHASGDESKYDGFFNSSCECHCTYEGQRCRSSALVLELDPDGDGEVTKTCGCKCIKAGTKCSVATQEDDPNGDGVRGDDCMCRCAEEGEACDWDVAGNPIKWKDSACNCTCKAGNKCKVKLDSSFSGTVQEGCTCTCDYGLATSCTVADQTLSDHGDGYVSPRDCRCHCLNVDKECKPVKDHEDVDFPPGIYGGKTDSDCLCQCDPSKKGVRCTKADWDYFGSLQEDCDCKCSKDDDTTCDYNGGTNNGKVKDCKCICNETAGTECNKDRTGREGRKNWSSDCLCEDCVASGSITINVGGTDVSCSNWDTNCMCSCDTGQDCHIDGTPDGSKTGKTTKECTCTCDKDNLPKGKCKPVGSDKENGEWGDDCDCHCKYTDEDGVEHKEGDYCQYWNGEEYVPGKVDKACKCQCDVEVGGSCTITKGSKVEFGHWSKDCKCEPCDGKGKDDCGVTDPRQYWNKTLCECRCLPAELAKPCTGEDEGKIRDPKTCKCTECDKEALAKRCWGDAKENYDTCDCYCDEQELGPCPEGQHHMADKGCKCGCDDDGSSCGGPSDPDHYWSKTECKCKCTKSVDEVCGDKPGHVKDEDCSCECNSPVDAPSGCKPPTFWWDYANCECKCMQDDSGCEDGKTRNPKKNCKCDCDDSVFQKCDINPLLMRDPDGRCKCACDVNAYRRSHGGKDPCEYYGYAVGKVTDDCGCECKCTKGATACASDHCDVTEDGGAPRQVWDAATCSCKCNPEPCTITVGGTPLQYPRDPKTCACACPKELASQCNEETQAFDPDKCSCYCKAGHTESDCKAKGKNFQFHPNDCTCDCPNTMEGYCKEQGRELNTEKCECEKCKRKCPEDGDKTKPDLDDKNCRCYCNVQKRRNDCESNPKKSFDALTCSCKDKKCDNEPSAEEKARRAVEECQVWDSGDCDWVDDSSGWRQAQQDYLTEIADKQRKLNDEITCKALSTEPYRLTADQVKWLSPSSAANYPGDLSKYDAASAAFTELQNGYSAYVSELANAASTARSMQCPDSPFPAVGSYSASLYNAACELKNRMRKTVNAYYDEYTRVLYG